MTQDAREPQSASALDEAAKEDAGPAVERDVDIAPHARSNVARDATALIENAHFEDIARRLLMQQSIPSIAQAHGYSTRHVYKILRRPEFEAVYTRVRDAFYGDLDSLIRDEKAAPLLRARAQATRAQTVVAEVLEEARRRVVSRQAKAADMRVAVTTAFGIMDRSQTELAQRTTKHEHNVNVLSVNATSRELIRSTLNESGLDLSDIIDLPAQSALPAATAPIEPPDDHPTLPFDADEPLERMEDDDAA